MTTDDECILSRLGGNIRPISKPDRSILLPISNADRQWKLGQTSITERLDDVLPRSVVGNYHAAVGCGGGARPVLHRRHGTGQLGQNDVV